MNLEKTISAAVCALGLAILPAVQAQADDHVVVGPGTSIGTAPSPPSAPTTTATLSR
ncbi:hypothetical protein [Nocardia asteroides]|uniref:hypothetical protein n=1 Tax=Nocardia asteroides TaxID=1824 RepID=UPI00365A0691